MLKIHFGKLKQISRTTQGFKVILTY